MSLSLGGSAAELCDLGSQLVYSGAPLSLGRLFIPSSHGVTCTQSLLTNLSFCPAAFPIPNNYVITTSFKSKVINVCVGGGDLSQLPESVFLDVTTNLPQIYICFAPN